MLFFDWRMLCQSLFLYVQASSYDLIFTTFLYYPMRMIINPRYARRFWRQECLPWLAAKYRSFTLYWFIALAVILTLLCAPYQSEFIAGYLVPVIFIVYFIGISRIGHALLRISWSVSAFLLVVYNKNFLQGVKSVFMLNITNCIHAVGKPIVKNLRIGRLSNKPNLGI